MRACGPLHTARQERPENMQQSNRCCRIRRLRRCKPSRVTVVAPHRAELRLTGKRRPGAETKAGSEATALLDEWDPRLACPTLPRDEKPSTAASAICRLVPRGSECHSGLHLMSSWRARATDGRHDPLCTASVDGRLHCTSVTQDRLSRWAGRAVHSPSPHLAIHDRAHAPCVVDSAPTSGTVRLAAHTRARFDCPTIAIAIAITAAAYNAPHIIGRVSTRT